jgi:hypothetical protein
MIETGVRRAIELMIEARVKDALKALELVPFAADVHDALLQLALGVASRTC